MAHPPEKIPQNQTRGFNHSSIWVSKSVNWGRNIVDSTFLAGMGTIGWIPVVLLIFAVDINQMSPMLVIGLLFACIGVMIAPIDIWYYDERLLPKFFEDIEEVAAEEEAEKLNQLATRFDNFYSNYWWVSTIPWAMFGLAVYVIGLDYFQVQGISSPVEQIAFLGFALYWILIAGLRSHAVLTTLLAIRTVVNQIEPAIDPLHPDGLGGLSAFGTLAIQTTIIISTGSFTLPLSFQFATHLQYESVIYAATGLFILLVASNFLYPTYKVNRRAQTIRETMLENRRRRIRELESAIKGAAENSTDAPENPELIQLEIQRARKDYDDFRNVTLYPLSIGIIIRLATSILLPIFFTVLDLVLSRIV